jgi:cytochrome c-type biogenesis protein CcmF
MLGKNVMLMRDAPLPIKDNFEATYLKDTIERQTRTFAVQFRKRDEKGNYTGEQFTLHPNVMYDRQFAKVVASNPSTQHYWNYDIFTHVSSLPKAELDPEYAKQQEDSLKYVTYEALPGDTIYTKEHYIVVEEISKLPVHPEYKRKDGDLAFGLKMRAYSLEDRRGYPLEPMMYLRPGEGAFALAYSAPQLEIKAKLTEKGMEKIFKTEEALKYESFGVKQGESFLFNGYNITFTNITKDVKHPNYTPEADDIAVAAELDITAPNGTTYKTSPVYLIRGSQPFSLKDEIGTLGLNFMFQKIDPATGVLTIGVAQATEEQRSIPVEIAENSGRSDYIVLEAIIFPGINFVWIGSILMMIGLALALWQRRRMQ